MVESLGNLVAESDDGAVTAQQNRIPVGTLGDHNPLGLGVQKLFRFQVLLKCLIFNQCVGVGQQLIFVGEPAAVGHRVICTMGA